MINEGVVLWLPGYFYVSVTRPPWCQVVTRLIISRWSAHTCDVYSALCTLLRSCHNNPEMVHTQKCWGLITGELEMLGIAAEHCWKFCKMSPVWLSETIYHNLTEYFCSIWWLMCLVRVISDVTVSPQITDTGDPVLRTQSPEEVRDQVPYFW